MIAPLPPVRRRVITSPWRCLLAVCLLAIPTRAAENLLPNGDFDAGADTPDQWEAADGLTSFWTTEPGRGRILRLDTRPDRKQVLEYWAARKQDPATPAPDPVIPVRKLDSVAAYEGTAIDSVLMEVKPDQDYCLSVAYRGRRKPFVWIKGFMLHPKRQTLTDCYQTRLEPAGDHPDEWRTYAITFRPTPATTRMKVRIYAYWPPDVYHFDAVSVTPISPEEAAALRAKRSEVPAAADVGKAE